MSNIVRNVAILALLTNDVEGVKLIQKNVLSLKEIEQTAQQSIPKADQNSESKLMVAQSFATADAMELEDQPVVPSLFQVQKAANAKGKTQSWAQEFADEYDKEEVDAGMPHDVPKMTMKDVHNLSAHLLQPATKLSEELVAKQLAEANPNPMDHTTASAIAQEQQSAKQQEVKVVKPVVVAQPVAAPVVEKPKPAPVQAQTQTSIPQAPVEKSPVEKAPVEMQSQSKVESQSQTQAQEKGLPQSGSPISDTIISGFKKITGKSDSEVQQYSTTEDENTKDIIKNMQDTNGNGIDYLKYSETKGEKFGTDLNMQTLKPEPKKEEVKKEEPKKQEVKKEEPKKVEVKKEEPKKEEIKKEEPKKVEVKKEEPKKVEAPPAPKQEVKPAAPAAPVDQKTQIQEEVKKIIKDQDNDDDQQISKVAATIKTDEEQYESIMKDIKTEKSQEMQEVKKEMSQLKAGEFDSLLSSGGAAYPEAREKEQQQQAPPAPKPVPALTKVAQNLGENMKPQSLGLEDLKNAQAQIQQMINTMELQNTPAVAITKK